MVRDGINSAATRLTRQASGLQACLARQRTLPEPALPDEPDAAPDLELVGELLLSIAKCSQPMDASAGDT